MSNFVNKVLSYFTNTLDPELHKVIQEAENIANKVSAKSITVEHILLSVLNNPSNTITILLASRGVNITLAIQILNELISLKV